MDAREDNDFWGRAKGGFNKSVDKMASYQWAKFCVELRTDLFGWTREKTMILGRAEGGFNKLVDKMTSDQRGKF